SLFTFIQLAFLTVVTFNYKKGKKLSNRILSGFLFSNALLIAQTFLTHSQLIANNKFTIIFSIGNSSYFLLAPFLFLYIQSLCYKEFKLKPVYLLHLLPFFITLLFFLYVQYTPLNTNHQSLGYIEYLSHRIILHLQIFSYLMASAILLIRYRIRLKELYSSIEKIDLSWCNLILLAFAVMWFLDLSNWSLGLLHLSSGSLSHWMFISSLLINLMFTLAVAYKGLTQSETFLGIQTYGKYSASRLKHSDCEKIIERLNLLMLNEKPFLNPSITAEDLAQILKIPPKHLSQAVNTCLNKNFFNLINSYRIEEAKKLINCGKYQNQTLLALAYDVGFNSKSVFNAAFKKYAGITPKEFKNQPALN
ncbi:MAG TPA: helix-turn-helix domain-containing protein, partial [Ignavibacteriaceae bacterium]|nr:helix-turn-helix domain-containing protein [Ignavibacteriaceae bacterium]